MKQDSKKTTKKRTIITCIVAAAIVAIFLIAYNLYRYPAALRHLSDNSLNESSTETLKESILNSDDVRILVSYFSYSGTTEGVANEICSRTGGDLFEIAPKGEYSDVYARSNSEIRKGERPELREIVQNIADYDIVFIGYPVWWHATPAPVNTFLESHDLTGKLIIPFCTSGGSDIDETMPTFLDSCDGLAVYGERRIGGAGGVADWLNEIGLGDAKSAAVESSTETTEAENEDAVVEADSTSETESSTEPETGSDEAAGKVLVAYFTWSGNTADMASYISEQTGGDLLELQPLNPYPDDYSETGDVAKKERDENARPEIANLPESLDGYDTIFIGYPIWWHTAPMIIGTFLEGYDLTGIDVYPFTQSASMDTEQFANSMDFVRENAQGANVHDGLFVRASDTEGILDYLSEDGFIK